MSMIGNFLQITPKQLEAILQDPATVEELIYPEDDENGDAIDIDKAWQAIHFALTNDPWAGEPPLANLILGGAEIGDDVGYGPARYLTPDEVASVAAAIEGIDEPAIASRLDRDQLRTNSIYPGIWDESEEECIGYVVQWYRAVRDYYLDAAGKGNAMLKFLN